eukprot:Nitzschia sp. Nitz4//scaffold338_size18487//7337//8869//NITZ4_008788-RA/size18487-processed-gene-0.4-mRNA-1//-1//CDS//3329548335//1001//frame0
MEVDTRILLWAEEPASSPFVETNGNWTHEVADSGRDIGSASENEKFTLKLAQWQQKLKNKRYQAGFDTSVVVELQALVDELLVERNPPSLYTYNIYLETIAKSPLRNGGHLAQQVLQQMLKNKVAPSLRTFLAVMSAWARRGNVEKAMKLFLHIVKQPEFQHSSGAYTLLIRAFGKAGHMKQVETIYQYLLTRSAENPVQASYVTFLETMDAFAYTSEKRHRVREVFEDMQKFSNRGKVFRIGIQAYNLLIRSLENMPNEAVESEQILLDLVEKYKYGERSAIPNTETFRRVLISQLSDKDGKNLVVKVKRMLSLHEWFYDTTARAELTPNIYLLNAALWVMSEAKEDQKAVHAKALFDKFKNHRISSARPDTRSYRHVLQACATTQSNEHKLQAFEIAVQVWQELTVDALHHPDGRCVFQFMEACANLLPEGETRDNYVKLVFSRCCADGLVDKMVWKKFKQAASSSLQTETIQGDPHKGPLSLPALWSRNVKAAHRPIRVPDDNLALQ